MGKALNGSNERKVNWDHIKIPCDEHESMIHPIQWEFQDPKLEVLYHIRPKIVVIFPYIGLKIGLIYGRYLQ